MSKFSGVGKVKVDEKKKVVATSKTASKAATAAPTLKVKVKSAFEQMLEI